MTKASQKSNEWIQYRE